MAMWIIAGVLVLLSIPLLLGKGSFLIAGFNTASEEEKAKYNEKKLCRAVGVFLLYTAVLTALFALVNTEWFTTVFLVLLALGIGVLMYFTNKKCLK